MSCENDWETPYIDIIETKYNVPGNSNELIIPVEANCNWEIISQIPSWIAIEQPKGSGSGELSINISANNSYARSCELVVVAYADTETITINQKASTSGTLSVKTGECTITGSWMKYYLTIDYTLMDPHLASKTGIEINGKKYDCSDSPSNYHSMTITMQTLSVAGLQYRAYAVNGSTGEYIYGNYKVIGK